MRFLKRKMALSIERKHFAYERKLEELPQEELFAIQKKNIQKLKVAARKKAKLEEHERKLATKNIIKNYGRAIANFILTPLFEPYMIAEPLMKDINWREFRHFVEEVRDNLVNLETFRKIISIDQSDDSKVVAFKKLFVKGAVIFIKYFSVNWIFDSKVVYKQMYLRFRGTLLRGVLDPSKLTLIPRPGQELV
jgi:hypothetical protein